MGFLFFNLIFFKKCFFFKIDFFLKKYIYFTIFLYFAGPVLHIPEVEYMPNIEQPNIQNHQLGIEILNILNVNMNDPDLFGVWEEMEIPQNWKFQEPIIEPGINEE